MNKLPLTLQEHERDIECFIASKDKIIFRLLPSNRWKMIVNGEESQVELYQNPIFFAGYVGTTDYYGIRCFRLLNYPTCLIEHQDHSLGM